jgi:hypothetical protein
MIQLRTARRVLNLAQLRELADEWREEAARLARRGYDREAHAAESYASELEGRLLEWELQELTLEQAASELGLRYDTLQRRVASGELPNAGRNGAPRVRRCDLYGDCSSKPQFVTVNGEPDIASEVLASRA